MTVGSALPGKAVHLTSVHPPEDVRIAWRECRSLCEAGHEVVLVAPALRSDEAGGSSRPPKLPPGLRLRTVPRARGRAGRILRTVPAVYRAARAEAPAIFHLHDPELLPVGLLLRARGHPVVYDVHEDVPRQIRAKPWIPRALRLPAAAVVAAVERAAARWISAMVAAVPAIAARFPPERTVLVRNFPYVDADRMASRAYRDRRSDVAYVGALSESRGLFTMLEIARRLPGPPGSRLVLAGRFALPSLEVRARRTPGWDCTDYRGWLPHPAVQRLLGEARVGLALLHPTPAYVDAYPTKMFEYMLAGLPVVVSDFPLWRDVVEDASCGILVDPTDSVRAAEAVTWLLEHEREADAMGRRGRLAVLERYNWAPEARRLLDLYAALEGGTG